jgi:predicted Zn-ribbon and HTH transcriptional regulator
MEFDLSKSLAIKNPELIDEWHPELNGSLTPYNVSYGSQKKVWWICGTNPSHVWSAQIEARHRGSKCPYCSGKKASIDYCLTAVNPELAEEWHPTKNDGLTSYDVVPYSNKTVWWKCKNCGNEWLARICWRNCGARCPECNTRKKSSISHLTKRSLTIVSPELIKEWHPVKNNGLTPDKISCTSSKKVWWICGKCGYEYEAKINKRQSPDSKCPSCKTTLITMDKSLEAVNPSLASEWHPVLNGSLKPEGVSANSLMEVYWLCEKCGFEWKAAIGSRSSNNTGCPNCKERKVLSPENCLAAIHPELIHQWDKERNGSLTPYDVFPGNLRRVYWQCSKGHKYQMRISDKCNGMGCIVCNRQQNTKFPKQALFYYLKEAFKDTKRGYLYTAMDKKVKLDIFIPSLNLGIEYDGYFSHMRPNSDVFDEQKNAVLKDAIQLIRVREEGLPQINPFGSEVYVRSDATENSSLLKCLISIGEYVKSHCISQRNNWNLWIAGVT